METLSNVQSAVSATIAKSLANFKKTPEQRLNIAYIETRLESLEQQWQVFFETHIKIISTVEQAEILESDYHKKSTYEEVEELYIDFKSDLKDRLQKLIKSSSCRSTSRNCTESGRFNLPEIIIPKFSGQYEEWQSFKELFVGLIHNNKSLDNTQRLYYLKSLLTGDAEKLLKNIPKLVSRYNNKKYMANSILNRLLDQQTLNSESANGIKQIVSTTCDCLEAIQNLGVDVSTWDIIIVNIISSKLDKDTRKAWELSASSDGSDELPTLDQFTQFLTARYRCLENLGTSTHTEKDKIVSHPLNIQTFHVRTGTNKTSNVSCIYCKSNHIITRCTKFAKKCNNTRRDFARQKKLCFICMHSNHTAKECKISFRCHICKKRHHTLLHPSGTRQVMGETSSVGDGSVARAEGAVKSFVATASCNKDCHDLGRRGLDRGGNSDCMHSNLRISENKCKKYVNNSLMEFTKSNNKHYNCGQCTKDQRELYHNGLRRI
ncbi:hypothetical protein ABMA27_015948 [Loxostege sticticalis]|uniref:Uncharacterized protein n=1 Tax=Loxostege sticticalis TaxID=481309 RepID=A0ABR3I4X2_LOXSC